MRPALAILLALAFSAAAASGQTSIALRPFATIEPGRAVRLNEVATVAGPDADRLGEAVVLELPAGTSGSGARQTIDLATVRAVLDRAKVNWGRVALSGSRCTLNRSAEEAAPEPPAATHRATVAFEQADTIPPGTFKAVIASRLADLYSVAPDSLRLAFRSADDDRVFLAGAVPAGQRVEVAPGASSASGRLSVRVDVYKASSLVWSRTITVDALVRRVAALTSSPVDRGTALDAGAFTTEERWLSPSADVPLRQEDLVGQTVRKRLEPGKPISRDDVRPPVVVSRGDVVWVHVLSGTVSMKAKARALDSAVDGDDVPLQLDGSKKVFKARMSGRGTAVLECTGGAESPPVPDSTPSVPRTRTRGGR